MKNFKEKLMAETVSHSGVLIVQTEDEQRLEELCQQVAEEKGYEYWRWTFTAGLVCVSNPELVKEGTQELGPFFNSLFNWDAGPGIVVAHDLISFMREQDKGPMTPRMLKDLAGLQKQLNAKMLAGEFSEVEEENAAKCVVQLVICDDEETPKSFGLSNYVLELPDRSIHSDTVSSFLKHREVADVDQEALLDASAGLASWQFNKALHLTYAHSGGLDPNAIQLYKRDAIKARGLTYIDPDPRGFDALGGLEPFKAWFRQRAFAFDRELAKEYDVTPPRGVLVAGVPGCGKSAAARALAASWTNRPDGSKRECPLLYFNLGETRARFHGESEKNLQRVLDTVDILGASPTNPVVLFLDEAEKMLSGGAASADLDGGVGGRTLQAFLTWLQEHTSSVFTYMAANRPSLLPPEIMRQGRLDGLWWIDLPTTSERRAIIEIYKAQYRKAANVDVDQLVVRSRNCSGSEIEGSFREAAIEAMANGQPSIQTTDVVAQLDKMSKVTDTFTLSEELATWKKAAMKANSPEDPAELVDASSPAAAAAASPTTLN